MVKRFWPVVAVLIFVFLAYPVNAAAPDFSGTWILDKGASQDTNGADVQLTIQTISGLSPDGKTLTVEFTNLSGIDLSKTQKVLFAKKWCASSRSSRLTLDRDLNSDRNIGLLSGCGKILVRSRHATAASAFRRPPVANQTFDGRTQNR
jgi:hypothetical protein